ncbi:MAG: hypothetical protein LC798_15605 [Chloroflexi bacterium]|nr:hypothetical protein [Chloroflexota bacterium]
MPLTGPLGLNTGGFPTNWPAPSVDDVASLMFARVTGEFGSAQTFSATTRPSTTQVGIKIRQAMSMVAPRVGFELDERLHESARFLVVLYTATLLEPGYWPEQLQGDMSAWDEWRALYTEGMTALLHAIEEIGEGGEAGPADDSVPAVWGFGAIVCAVPGAERPVADPCSRRHVW